MHTVNTCPRVLNAQSVNIAMPGTVQHEDPCSQQPYVCTTHQSSGPALGAGERLVYEIPHAVAKPAGVPLQAEQRRVASLKMSRRRSNEGMRTQTERMVHR